MRRSVQIVHKLNGSMLIRNQARLPSISQSRGCRTTRVVEQFFQMRTATTRLWSTQAKSAVVHS